jgi:hypothetical protein
MRCVLLATVFALIALGCSSRKAGPVPVHEVSGVVTYKGQPVVGADLTFFNKELDRSAFGRTDEQGRYRLTTFSINDGAVAGKHIVTIAKSETPAVAPVIPDVESPEYMPPGLGESSMPAQEPPKSSFPEKYGSQETSGLIAVVDADAPNEIDFKITD